MRANKMIFWVGVLGFVGLMTFAFWQELDRNAEQLKFGISGVIDINPALWRGIVKTDNAHVILFDSINLKPVAMATINPFVPPITFYVGQEHVMGPTFLEGSYRMLVVSDKDGNIEKPTPGEVIGDLTDPIPLGTEEYHYRMSRPFRGLPPELRRGPNETSDPKTSIQGIVKVAPELEANLESSDRMVVLLFDPQMARPVAYKIIPHFYNNQPFSIGQADAMGGQPLKGPYSLRILTDKNRQPFESVPGELIGRSEKPIALGTSDLQFVLNQSYHSQ